MIRARNGGFSLIELMVSLVILSVVVVQVMSVFATQVKTHMMQERVVDAQEDARLVADMILTDLRMAGFMVPRMVGLSSVDGGTTGPDVLCISDPQAIDDSRLALSKDRFSGTELIASVAGGYTSVSLDSTQKDIDGDGDDDFLVGQGIIFSDGTGSHCARITEVHTSSVVFVPPTPTGFNVDAGGIAVPAIIYELAGSGLLRNSQLLSPHVEDLQLEYGIDNDSDGQISSPAEFPIHDINGSITSQIRGVRLTVITRTSQEDQDLTGPGRLAAANRAASGTSDNFRRRLATVVAAPRNML